MKHFELTNAQREYFGLDPIKKHWVAVPLQPDAYRPASIVYFDGNILKKHIVSTPEQYCETQYNEQTENRQILLPKTSKGKPVKLTASTLEQRKAAGIYLNISSETGVLIASHTTETTFYATRWVESNKRDGKTISASVDEFITQSPPKHLAEIANFKRRQKQRFKFKPGDYFRFKIQRDTFGFGRVLLDIAKIRKAGVLAKEHGLNLIMGPPVLVQLYIFESKSPEIEISELAKKPKLPSDLMMDNLLLYGEFEIIGFEPLVEADFDFPISYGRSIDQRQVVFLQWGLIHRELPLRKFDKFLVADNPLLPEGNPSRRNVNPYGYYSIGFRPRYGTISILRAIQNDSSYDFSKDDHFTSLFDLRNPKNHKWPRRDGNRGATSQTGGMFLTSSSS